MDPHPLSDFDNLLAAARSGNGEALWTILRHYQPFLLRIARLELNGDMPAKERPSDLAQRSLLEAHKDFPRFAGGSPKQFCAWLRRIVINNRKDGRKPGPRGRNRSLDESGVRDHVVNHLASNAPTPIGALMARERDEAALRVFQSLPEDYCQVIHYRQRDEKEFAEIAGLMDRSEQAVRRLYARAVRRWREQLERHYGPI